MLEFKPVELSDKLWVDPLVAAENSRSADFNFGNIFIWNSTYRQKLCRIGDRVTTKLCYKKKPFFSFPIGSGDLRPVIEELLEYSQNHNFPLLIMGLTQEHTELLEKCFPGKFSFDPNRRFFDYVYSAEKLATLRGKKLHSKRNHINRFIENNSDWSFEPLRPSMAGECLEMVESWMEGKTGEDDQALESEHEAIERALEYYGPLGLDGGLLRSGGKIIGFTIGEKISSDTFNVHFEKAFGEIQGAYPMLNREFVRLVLQRHQDVKYINREDDVGEENLRKAKLSYYPEFLVEKFTASWEG